MTSDSEYLQILRLYTAAIGSLVRSRPSDQRLIDAQSLALKLFEHAVAVYSLSQGVELQSVLEDTDTLVVQSSVNVLARAILEAFLAFHCIFIDPKNEDEFEFRYCAWQLRGLAMREEFGTVTSPQDGVRLAENKEFNNALRARIERTEEYRRKKSKQQARILEGKWLFPKWVEIAASAEIDKHLARICYALLSDYNHSGALSALQMEVLSVQKRDELIQTTLEFVKAIMARMTAAYVKKFPRTKEVLEGDPETARLVEVYSAALGMMQ
jgi:hypothetical protein